MQQLIPRTVLLLQNCCNDAIFVGTEITFIEKIPRTIEWTPARHKQEGALLPCIRAARSLPSQDHQHPTFAAPPRPLGQCWIATSTLVTSLLPLCLPPNFCSCPL